MMLVLGVAEPRHELAVQRELAVARAERAERHALALETKAHRMLGEVEAVALEEEQKARLAEERRVVAERQLAALEERHAHELRLAEARIGEERASAAAPLRGARGERGSSIL